MRAATFPAAVAAVQHRRVTTAVEEHQALFTARDAVLQGGDQGRRQRRIGSLAFGLLIHIDQTHFGQLTAAYARRQSEPHVTAFLGALPAFQ